MAKSVHKTLSKKNAEVLLSGIKGGLSYDAIGRLYVPPVCASTAYKHAVKMGMVDNHPRRGKRQAPYSRNPREA